MKKKSKRQRQPRPLGQPPKDSYGIAETSEIRSPIIGTMKHRRVPLGEADIAFLPPSPKIQRRVEAIQAQGPRICQHEAGCTTILNWANPGKYCSIHTPRKDRGKKLVGVKEDETLGCDAHPTDIAKLAESQPTENSS